MEQDEAAISDALTNEEMMDFRIEVHLFACGHGDTILVRLPGPKWMLIDCNLPKYNGVYARFLRYLQELAEKEGQSSFRRLDWVILTHPDEDHYKGMASLLEHFTHHDRSLGRWMCSGLSSHDLRALVWPDEQTKRGYRELRQSVQKLIDNDLLLPEFVHDNSREMSPTGYMGRIEIFPIAPSAKSMLTHAKSDLPRIGRKQDARVEANALSIVLVLSVIENGKSFNFLLAGDAGPEELEAAINIWHSRAEEYQRDKSIHVIKVPHHGSWNSHWSGLPGQNSRSEGVAVISAGTRAKLPDREVLRDYMRNGWIVMSTTTIHMSRSVRMDRPMTLSNRSRTTFAENREFAEHDITVRWQAKQGISHYPPDARVQAADLVLYDSAAEKGAT